MNTPTKRCSTCGEHKPIGDFYKNRRQPDGLQNTCKSCMSLYGKIHYAKNKDKINQRHHDWRKENREIINGKSREKYANNRKQESIRKRIDRTFRPAVYKARSRRYRENNYAEVHRKENERAIKNRERNLARSRATYAAEPWKAYIRLMRRRARKQSLPDNFTHDDWQFALCYWDNACAVCDSTNRIEADHWIPLNASDCPGTVITNIVPLCRHCNRSKKYTIAMRWLTSHYPTDQAQHIADEIDKFFHLVSSRTNCEQR